MTTLEEFLNPAYLNEADYHQTQGQLGMGIAQTPKAGITFDEAIKSRMYWRDRDLYLGMMPVGHYIRDDAAKDDACFVGFVVGIAKPVAAWPSALDAKFAVEHAVIAHLDYVA